MTDGHLLPEQLAEHAEGLFDSDDSRAVDAHLRGCAQCRETAAALEAVSGRLADAPRTLPTPADVATRVDRALAAERGERARRAEAAPVGLLERLRARMPALAAATAGAAVLGFAGWAASTGVLGGGGDDAATESAAEAPREVEQEPGGDSEAAPPDDAAQEESGGSDGRDESADELRAGEGEQAVPDDATVLRDPAALEEQVLAIVRGADGGDRDDRCGSVLAGEQQVELVGSAPADLGSQGDAPGAVLVVLEAEEADTVRGWVLPACDAGPAEALAPALTVPVE